jgi:hypothetical protein
LTALKGSEHFTDEEPRMGSVAEWSKALDLSISYLTPSGENPREFEPRRYQFAFFPNFADSFLSSLSSTVSFEIDFVASNSQDVSSF